MSLKLGYHISIKDGLTKTAKEIKDKKLSAVQIFPGSPKSYFPGEKHTNEDFNAMKNLNIPKFVHINYFVNPAGDNAVIPKSIAENMIFCDKIGADGLVIHMGSHKKIDEGMVATVYNIKESINKFVELTGNKPNVKILIETTSEGGNRLKIDKILEFVEKYGKMYNVGITYDTAHMYAAGYDVVKQIEELHDVIDLVHLNNPSPIVEFGKHKDQHDIPLFSEEGKLTNIQIENVINLCKLYDIPMVMENLDDEISHNLICEKYKNHI